MSLHDLSNTIDRALTAAGLTTRRGPGNAVLETIRKALESARIAQAPPHGRGSANGAGDADADVIDVDAKEIVDAGAGSSPDGPKPSMAGGRFLSFRYAGTNGTLAYKLYVPSSYVQAARMPLVVMLHGCKQDPDDFARGTRINVAAEEQGFLVAYPAQSVKANGSNCWNWFEPRHQGRSGAEPSVIAGIVREIGAAYRIDGRKVYAAGLSAGAAMAVILGESYPDLFAAVAAHSGLPHGAAHDVASAFAAMRGAASSVPARAPVATRTVPTIVFHGAADATVDPSNGAAIARRSVALLTAERGVLACRTEQSVANGRRCTRTTHVDRNGLPVVEQWSVAGGGHAWFGGSRAGSFTDPDGPDATREMMRFLMQHARREPAETEAAQNRTDP